MLFFHQHATRGTRVNQLVVLRPVVERRSRRVLLGAVGSDAVDLSEHPRRSAALRVSSLPSGVCQRQGSAFNLSLATVGPLARTAEDCALMLQTRGGDDTCDQLSG